MGHRAGDQIAQHRGEDTLEAIRRYPTRFRYRFLQPESLRHRLKHDYWHIEDTATEEVICGLIQTGYMTHGCLFYVCQNASMLDKIAPIQDSGGF